MKRKPSTNPQIDGKPMSFVSLSSRAYRFTDSDGRARSRQAPYGNTRISGAAGARGENPPGTRAARRRKRTRRAIETASRKRNR